MKAKVIVVHPPLIESPLSMQGVPLEKMEELLSKPWLERTNVWYYLRCGCFLEPLCRGRRGRRGVAETEDRVQLTGSRDQLSSSSSSTSTSDVPGPEEEGSTQLGKGWAAVSEIS